jgi:ribosomal protein S18 acetylase RimI-like enzyme
MELIWAGTEHELYESERALRTEVLRKPLGFAEVEKFPFEDESLHLLVVEDWRVVGCLLFRPQGDTGRLYQMAVYEEHRGRGLGRRLVKELEQRLSREGFTSIYLHARTPVIGFYEKLDYRTDSEVFIEIGIEHRRMIKKLEPGST